MTPFHHPTFLQVHTYALSIGFPDLDVQRFLDHYEMRDWKINYGGKLFPMASWKRAVITWKNRHEAWRVKEAVVAQSVVDAEAVRQRLLAGEHVTRADKCKLPAQKQLYLVEDSAGLFYYPGRVK